MSCCDKLTIFLSHSHRDIEKVRKIRDLLEILNFEPICFHLICLDDNNDKLEQFIKDEISARDIFLYCKSENAEKSLWVQKEVEYIKSLKNKRFYEINIDGDYSENLISTLKCIVEIKHKNTIVLYSSEKDIAISDKIYGYLKKYGFCVIRTSPICVPNVSYPSMKGLKAWEYEKSKTLYENFFDKEILPWLEKTTENALLIPIITDNLCNGDWNSHFSSKFTNWFRRHKKTVLPVYCSDCKNNSSQWLFYSDNIDFFDKLIDKIINI